MNAKDRKILAGRQFKKSSEMLRESGIVLTKVNSGFYIAKADLWELRLFPGRCRHYYSSGKGPNLPKNWTLSEAARAISGKGGESSTMPCITCFRELRTAADDWSTIQPSGGCELQIIGSYGSTRFDGCTFAGVVCDQCAQGLRKHMRRL